MRTPFAALLLAPLLYVAGSGVETAALWLVAALLTGVLVLPWLSRASRHSSTADDHERSGPARATRHRDLLLEAASALLLAALLSLLLHLFRDDVEYRTVWLYSGTGLAWWLKLSALWAGEEGTLLLLAAGCTLGALGLRGRGQWSLSGIGAVALGFVLGTLIWPPFAGAPAEAVALPDGRGLNAHLDSIWMALHPPLVLLAYVALLMPLGAALQSLALGAGPLGALAQRWLRLGWLLLGLGLATGMAWSYEDATFGQLWHWDPVQTAVFAAWALATGALHGLRVHHPKGPCARSVPLLILAAGAAVLVAMAVTRSQTLASSHRYIGATAQPLLLGMAGTVLLAGLWASWRGRGRITRRVGGGTMWLRRAAMMLFTGFAAVALLAILQATMAAWLELPRPEATQPFFATVRRWGGGDLLLAFARWEVDPYAMNRWLAPPAALLAMLGGHVFLDRLPRRVARALTALVTLLALTVASWLSPLSALYSGSGMTSLQTLENFFWLDLLFVALLWLLACAGYRAVLALRLRHDYLAGVAMLHAGAALALGALLAATVLDSYTQRSLRYPEDFDRPQRFADGYALQLSLLPARPASDGARIETAGAGFVAEAQATLSLPGIGEVRGLTRLREAAPPAPGDGGATRQLCEFLDYRYARAAGSASRRLDPLITRGLWRDVQLWVPAPEYRIDADGRAQPLPGELTVVIKSFPLLTWLWLGLSLLCLAGAWLTLRAWRQPQPG